MKSSAQTAVVVFNASAGRGQGRAIAVHTSQFLIRTGWRVVARAATPACSQDRTALVQRLAARADRLAVVDGDGTLREVCAALQASGRRVALGLVPIGNANVLARELNIPFDPLQAIRLLTRGCPRAVDAAVMMLSGQDAAPTLFMAMLEIGFGAAVVHRVHR